MIVVGGDIKTINLGFVNAFLVRVTDGFILVDTGISQQWPRLEKELAAAGCQPGKLKLVVITHGDRDHTGNCLRLQKEFGAKIAMHEKDLSMVQTGEQRKRTINNTFMKLIMTMGQIVTKLQKSNSSFDKFMPDILLIDGQSLQEYGWKAKVIHVPGHTKGSIVILTEEGELLAGDTLNNMRRPTIAPIIEDFDDLNKSLEIIKGLNIKKVYPGHGKPFSPADLPGLFG